MIRSLCLIFFSLLFSEGFTQYSWKLQKDDDSIKVYLSDVPNSKLKAVKVDCTFRGTFNKLISILCNISHNNEWVYNSKKNIMVKKNTPLDFIYYTETHFPWPLDNRDVVIHLRIQTDSLPRFLTVSGSGEPNLVPEIFGKVRVPQYSANWTVTMPTSQTVQISYILVVDPGGSIPSWVSNIFIDKGPYETFKKLAELLAK